MTIYDKLQAAVDAYPARCDTCSNIATVNCTWGLYELRGEPRTEPMQNADLCGQCSDDLWQRCKSAVNSGIMHWMNKPANS